MLRARSREWLGFTRAVCIQFHPIAYVATARSDLVIKRHGVRVCLSGLPMEHVSTIGPCALSYSTDKLLGDAFASRLRGDIQVFERACRRKAECREMQIGVCERKCRTAHRAQAKASIGCRAKPRISGSMQIFRHGVAQRSDVVEPKCSPHVVWDRSDFYDACGHAGVTSLYKPIALNKRYAETGLTQPRMKLGGAWSTERREHAPETKCVLHSETNAAYSSTAAATSELQAPTMFPMYARRRRPIPPGDRPRWPVMAATGVEMQNAYEETMSAMAIAQETGAGTVNSGSKAAIANMSVAPIGRLRWATRHELTMCSAALCLMARA
jgi:hypothetical protein